MSRRALSPQAPPMPLPAQPQGCKGRSPLHKKAKNSPFPGGEERSASAGRGMGAEKQAKSRVGRRQGRHVPRRATARQGQPARQKTLSRVPRRIPVPSGHFLRRFSQYRFRLSPGDARGEAPCIRKPKNLPLPRRGRGGGWGKKRKVKAGAAGGKAGKPPSGFRKGIVIRRPPGQAPRRVLARRFSQCRPGSVPGMQGAQPLA